MGVLLFSFLLNILIYGDCLVRAIVGGLSFGEGVGTLVVETLPRPQQGFAQKICRISTVFPGKGDESAVE